MLQPVAAYCHNRDFWFFSDYKYTTFCFQFSRMWPQKHYSTPASGPSFSPLRMISPSLNALRNPGLVDAVHRVSGRSRIAPRNGLPPLTMGYESGTRRYPGQTGMSSPGRRPFLPGPMSPPSPPPYPTTHGPAIVRTDRKGFHKKQFTC